MNNPQIIPAPNLNSQPADYLRDPDDDINEIFADIRDAQADQLALSELRDAELVKGGKIGVRKLLGIPNATKQPMGEIMTQTSAPQEASAGFTPDDYLLEAQAAAASAHDTAISAADFQSVQGEIPHSWSESNTDIAADLARYAQRGASDTGAPELAHELTEQQDATIATIEQAVSNMEYQLKLRRLWAEEIIAARQAAVRQHVTRDDFALGA